MSDSEANVPVEIPVNHMDHWREPLNQTLSRPIEDLFCEFCGEKIPWHNVSCRLLKQAYKTRLLQCQWCDRHLSVGTSMYTHTTTVHADKLTELNNLVKKQLSKEH